MATTALDVVSVAEVKDELRIPQRSTSRDSMLTRHIEAAVSFVSQHIGYPIVDRQELYYVNRIADKQPIRIRANGIKEINRVRYWTPSGDILEDPTGTIAVGDLGRQYPAVPVPGICVDAPVAGWPEILDNSQFEVRCVRGVDRNPDTAALVQATILCVRQFYDGYREIKPTEAFYALLKDWQYKGPIEDKGVEDVSATPPPPPVTVSRNYIGVSTDSTFTAAEFTSSSTDDGLAIPAIPSGERRYVSFAHPETEGAFSYVYLYPLGNRNTHNQIGNWAQQSGTVNLHGIDYIALVCNDSFADFASGFIVEAG